MVVELYYQRPSSEFLCAPPEQRSAISMPHVVLNDSVDAIISDSDQTDNDRSEAATIEKVWRRKASYIVTKDLLARETAYIDTSV